MEPVYPIQSNRMLFDEPTLRKLKQLTLVASRVRAGILKGDRRSTRRGSSIEFADYRNYTAGDDLRRLDWNIFARLDRAYIKLLEEEEDLAVHVLIDTSKSMDWGEGEEQKLVYALRLSAAIGAITLSTGDRLDVSTLHDGAVTSQLGPLRGELNLIRLLDFLEAIKPGGATDLVSSMRSFSLASNRPGLTFLISDLWSPHSLLDAFSPLQARGHEVIVIHTLTPDEIDPPLAGDLRLIDVETGQAQEVSLDSGLRDLYRKRIEQWRIDIQKQCRQRGIHYLSLETDQPWEKVILYEMRRVGLVKS